MQVTTEPKWENISSIRIARLTGNEEFLIGKG